MRLHKITLILFFAAILSGCASVLSGTDQKISFKSEPEGATVLLDGLVVGVTPLTLKVRKDEFREIRFSKAEYSDSVTRFNTRMDNITFINLTSVVFYSTDAMTGAMFEYSPNAYFVTLDKIRGNNDKQSHLDGHAPHELNLYVMQYFNQLRQQCTTDCANEHIDMLAGLIAREFDTAPARARLIAIQALDGAVDAVDYLQRIRVGARTES